MQILLQLGQGGQGLAEVEGINLRHQGVAEGGGRVPTQRLAQRLQPRGRHQPMAAQQGLQLGQVGAGGRQVNDSAGGSRRRGRCGKRRLQSGMGGLHRIQAVHEQRVHPLRCGPLL